MKSSGGDSASIKLDGFATLYMDKLTAEENLYRGVAFEDPRWSATCRALSTSTRARPPPSTRPARLCGISSTTCIPMRSSPSPPLEFQTLTKTIFGDTISAGCRGNGLVFELGLWLAAEFCANLGRADVILESHGLLQGGLRRRECYETTVDA